MQKLNLVEAETLLYEPLEKPSFVLEGLMVQLEDYLKVYPDSRLIVIDTLQKIRTASKDNACPTK